MYVHMSFVSSVPLSLFRIRSLFSSLSQFFQLTKDICLVEVLTYKDTPVFIFL